MSMTLHFDTAENNQVRTWIVRNGPLATSTPIDLTNASTVQLFIADPFPTQPKACTFIPSTAGQVSVEMDAADLTVSGLFNFKTRITFNDGTITDVPKPGYDQIAVGSAP